MAIKGVDTKCYILALFVRDDGERFLLGSGHYEFKDTQMHFAANAIQNDIVEVQGNDGFLLAGQVRRPGTQSFDGYVGDGTMSKEETESYRRQFFSFFRKNFFYKVIYVFSDGTAIQRKSGFLVDDPTVEELYQMYPEYHVALNFEDVNYYSYSEDEEGQEQYAKEATIDTSSMRATGGLVWDNLGVVWEATQWGGEQTASGTEMTIQNEMNVPSIVDDIRLDGDTEQQTYSGANLYNVNDPAAVGTGVTVDADGWITIARNNSGSSVQYYNYYGKPMQLAADTEYAVVVEMKYIKSNNLSNNNNYLNITDTNSSQFAQTYRLPFTSADPTQVGTHISVIRTKADISDASRGLRTFLTVAPGVDQEVTFRISVLADTSVTPETFVYEPYVGGVASPNPDSPEDIHTVTGEQMVEVRGKNLFHVTNPGTNFAWYGSSVTINTTTTSSYVNITSVNPMGAVTFPAGTYTISTDVATGAYSKVFRLRWGDSNHDQAIPKNATSQTFTAPEEFSIRQIFISNLSAGTTISDTFGLQLEEGSVATGYEPYQGQTCPISLGSTELCKLGDYQDYIYKGADGWYLHKECEKLVLDGSESWQRNDANEVFTLADTALYMRDGTAPFSNYFIGQANVTTFGRMENNKIGLLESATSNRIIIKYTAISTASAFKTWLSTHITDLYYPLATPTDTQITDNTLIGQLNALGAMKLFIGENNLAIQATGTNLPAPLSFKYYTTVAMTGAEWEEGGSGGATVVEVDSITNTYPIWRVKGPAVNPQLSVINTNTTIRYAGTVTSTQTLEIDMFNKTAKLNGVSVIGNVSGDWVSLAPGTNRVIYTAENADAQPSTIEWQEVVG